MTKVYTPIIGVDGYPPPGVVADRIIDGAYPALRHLMPLPRMRVLLDEKRRFAGVVWADDPEQAERAYQHGLEDAERALAGAGRFVPVKPTVVVDSFDFGRKAKAEPKNPEPRQPKPKKPSTPPRKPAAARPKPRKAIDMARLVELRAAGSSIPEIAKTLGISVRSAGRHLRAPEVAAALAAKPSHKAQMRDLFVQLRAAGKTLKACREACGISLTTAGVWGRDAAVRAAIAAKVKEAA